MRIYSDFAVRRTVEIVGDLVAVALVVVGVTVALALHGAIAAVGAVGQSFASSGQDIQSQMAGVATNISGVPVVGGILSAPFQGVAGAGRTLADAGRSFEQGVETVAALVGWTVAVLVVLVVVLGWVRPRVQQAVTRTRLARLAAAGPTLDLLAFRALVNQPARTVAAVEGAVDGWRRGDAATLHRLAALELRTAGVRVPPR